ncbi:MAG: O-antigen ligase domain-containing protein [Lentisphaerae bacterium]|mgnify:CR=1 FL=1|jgi:hypothetical protein|nr:O-antigen ligase domain-containing protein [Lentisphaerota bacterium]MBT4817043.1 O-antigen ligase domain-containing protein [Lentisphaerota bacterium]MBT5610401.1 O-antigen ligase domain-containing protein [Lentisphaerota bacterium]MBT7056229.1 O-antigen ligase domain-containing protein [Lentisphaerota bacterium]MBT7841849.1 O-antigen ligase domain-containing protein [Lentisphaerota bacterium]
MESGGFMVVLMYVIWFPVVVVIFLRFPPRKAVLLSFLAAWLFLPVARIDVGGMPDITKMSVTCLGILLGTALTDVKRLVALRPSLMDLPMALYCFSPLASSLSNGLGPYDGLSGSLSEIFVWGLPYYVGRIYITDLKAVRQLALAVFAGGLVYVPFCLFEVRFSPQLHRLIYGYHQHSFAQTVRYGGYRPMVFMEHGLMVGIWMAAGSVIGVWLLASGVLAPFLRRNVPFFPGHDRPDPPWQGTLNHICSNLLPSFLVGVMLLTTVMVKSTGALLLMIAALSTLFAAAKTRIAIPLLFLLLVPPAYIGTRTFGAWDGMNVVRAIARVRPDRAQSVAFRFENETLLTKKALQRPAFGWGGWGRSRIRDAEGRDLAVTDGMWIILLGTRGFYGMGLFFLAFLAPVYFLWRRFPMRTWCMPEVAPFAVMTVLLVIYCIDNLPNGMVNPIFALTLGGLTAVAATGYPTGDPLTDAVEDAPQGESAPAATRVLAS